MTDEKKDEKKSYDRGKLIGAFLVSLITVSILSFLAVGYMTCSDGFTQDAFFDFPCGNYTYVFCDYGMNISKAQQLILEDKARRGAGSEMVFEKTRYWCPIIKGG